MSSLVPPRRTIVLKTSRDTLVLLAAASAMALAIGYSVHNRPPADATPASEQVAAGEWTGQLASLAPSEAAKTAPAEPLSSDALTVPKAAMALPAPPRPATAPAKPRLCDGLPCPPPARTAAAATVIGAPAPARKPTGATHPQPIREAGLMDRLNPLNHIPDMVKRPFASAGDTIVGWVRHF